MNIKEIFELFGAANLGDFSDSMDISRTYSTTFWVMLIIPLLITVLYCLRSYLACQDKKMVAHRCGYLRHNGGYRHADSKDEDGRLYFYLWYHQYTYRLWRLPLVWLHRLYL